MALDTGLELLGLLYHLDDAVIAPAAAALFNADAAAALFDDRPSVDISAFDFAHCKRLTGYCRLIDHRLTGDDLAVKRDHPARADCDAVTGAHLADRDKDRTGVGLQPDLVYVERHRLRKVGDRLLVRPFIKNVANAEQEHYRARGLKIAAQHRNRYRRRVKHRYLYLAVQQAAQPRADILC